MELFVSFLALLFLLAVAGSVVLGFIQWIRILFK